MSLEYLNICAFSRAEGPLKYLQELEQFRSECPAVLDGGRSSDPEEDLSPPLGAAGNLRSLLASLARGAQQAQVLVE